jgi:hypothetical protein
MILQGLKPRIFDRLNKSGRKWLQELPTVVWSLRTTPSRATGFTPFFLVHGAEAILPTDLEYESPRVRGYDEGANQLAREDSLDQLDEARTVALMHSARYQQSLRRYQARKVWRRDFSEWDLVLRLRQDNRGRHKLSLSYGPPWAHYLGGYQDRLLGGPLGLPGLRYTASEGVEHKDYTEVVLG